MESSMIFNEDIANAIIEFIKERHGIVLNPNQLEIIMTPDPVMDEFKIAGAYIVPDGSRREILLTTVPSMSVCINNYDASDVWTLMSPQFDITFEDIRPERRFSSPKTTKPDDMQVDDAAFESFVNDLNVKSDG